jgi:rubrerythrin
MLDVSTASIKELLGFAVRSEIDSNKTYSDLAERVKNPLLKEKFQWLAYEEKKHKEVLEKLFDALFHGEKLLVPGQMATELIKHIEVTPSSGLVDILYQAMESEKSAENFYARLASRVDKPQSMLLSEYTLAQDFEDYAEKDIDKVIT